MESTRDKDGKGYFVTFNVFYLDLTQVSKWSLKRYKYLKGYTGT